MNDLLDLTAELVAIPSVSHNEQQICDFVEAELQKLPWLEVERIGDNLVARTNLGRSERLILGGHLDTVPPSDTDGDVGLRRDGDTLWGTGTSDMKGALAVFLALAREFSETSIDVSYIFYAREEVARKYSGLLELQATRPDLLGGDAAILGEPTDGVVEAGCQGSLRASVKVTGRRAHTARAWMGENAVHGLAALLSALENYQPRKPVIDSCEFHESMQAVSVSGGIAGNVVPDFAEVVISHRFAPDRSTAEAEQHLLDFVAEAFAVAARNDGSSISSEFSIEIIDAAPACPPSLDHPLLQSLIEAVGISVKFATSELEASGELEANSAASPVRAKLGWTDAAFFSELGIPATNFGPGDPLLAHAPDEHISAQKLQECYATLATVLVRV